MSQIEQTKFKVTEGLAEEFRNSVATGAWVDSTTKKLYVFHSGDPYPGKFDDSHYVMDVNAVIKVMDAKETGKLSESEYQDKINYAVWNDKLDWDKKAAVYKSVVSKHGPNPSNAAIAEDAQGLKPSDFAGLEVAVIEGTLYGAQERARTAQGALRTVPVNGTVREYPEQTSRVSVRRNIDFTSEIAMDAVTFKYNKIELKCDATHFAIYDHTKWRPLAVDPVSVNLQAHANAFVRDRADQTILLLTDTGITAITGADWGGAVNPYADFARAQAVINTNNGMADKTILHDFTRVAFRGNLQTKTVNETSRIVRDSSGVMSGGYFIEGYTNYVDPGMPTNVITIWDDAAAELDLGPSGTVRYRQDNRFREGFIRFEWNRYLITDYNKIRRITGTNTITPP